MKPPQKEITSVYLAGKMQEHDWREPFFDEYEAPEGHEHQLGCNPLTVEYNHDWPDASHVTVCGLRYTGPFFVDLGGHGYYYVHGHEHGNNIDDIRNKYDQRQKVQWLCLEAIENADLVFAWIDSTDCHGTIAEIGYAKALGKMIWIAGPTFFDDLWFVYSMANRTGFADSNPNDSPGRLFRWMLNSFIYQSRRFRHLDSPIEQSFWHVWCEVSDFNLETQYSIGRYRVDFAHPETKTVIELDGFASHSSTDDIANDRRRQREIEAMGWQVIRYGGKEIHQDVHKCVQEVYDIICKKASAL